MSAVLASLLASTALAAAVHLDVGSGDDIVRVTPLVLLQVDGRAVLHDDDNAVEGNSGFISPRARLGARLRWRFFEVQVVGEGSREKAGLLEAFGVVHVGDFAINAGLARSPLFIGGPDPLSLQPLNERGILERTLWPGRELGVGVPWLPTTVPVEAWLRVSNGVANAVLGNDNAGLAAEGRVDVVLTNSSDDDRDKNVDSDVDSDADSNVGRVFVGLRAGVSARVESTDNEAGMPGITPLGFTYWRAPPVSGPSSIVQAHVQGLLGPARLTLQGGFAHEGRAKDDDGNPATPKVTITAMQHAGASAEIAATVIGPRRDFLKAPTTASLTSPVIDLAVRGERLRLGLTPMNDTADPTVSAGGASAVSAAVTWWLHESLSVSAQIHALAYDVAPIDDPDRTSSLTALLRLTIVAL